MRSRQECHNWRRVSTLEAAFTLNVLSKTRPHAFPGKTRKFETSFDCGSRPRLPQRVRQHGWLGFSRRPPKPPPPPRGAPTWPSTCVSAPSFLTACRPLRRRDYLCIFVSVFSQMLTHLTDRNGTVEHPLLEGSAMPPNPPRTHTQQRTPNDLQHPQKKLHDVVKQPQHSKAINLDNVSRQELAFSDVHVSDRPSDSPTTVAQAVLGASPDV